MRGTSIYIEIYDSRVVIVNPGGLPSDITKANFGKESIRRNLIIADLFHRMGKVSQLSLSKRLLPIIINNKTSYLFWQFSN
ncbi:MAG: ATP-binding protein [bacterium]